MTAPIAPGSGTARDDVGPTLRLLSLGAGVQSTTVLLLACEGEIPRFDIARSAAAPAGNRRPSTPPSTGSPRTPRTTASRCNGCCHRPKAPPSIRMTRPMPISTTGRIT